MLQQPAGQIVLVPSRHDQHDAPRRLQPADQVASIPVPDLLPDDRIVRVVARLQRIVDQRQVRAPARDGAPNTRRLVFGAVRRVPGFHPLARQVHPQRVAVCPDPPQHLPREILRQPRRVRRPDHRHPPRPRHEPRREQVRHIPRLRRPRRHHHHQPVVLSGRDIVQLPQQEPMVPRRRLPFLRQRQPAPILQIPAHPFVNVRLKLGQFLPGQRLQQRRTLRLPQPQERRRKLARPSASPTAGFSTDQRSSR